MSGDAPKRRPASFSVTGSLDIAAQPTLQSHQPLRDVGDRFPHECRCRELVDPVVLRFTADDAAHSELADLLAPYLSRCRAGFRLISVNTPSIEEGVALAIVAGATAAELFALSNEPPFGQARIYIFFNAGCQPTA
jgi:hypothetical protein